MADRNGNGNLRVLDADTVAPHLRERVPSFWWQLRPRLEGRRGQVSLQIHRGQFQDHFGEVSPEKVQSVLDAIAQEARRDREAWAPGCTGCVCA